MSNSANSQIGWDLWRKWVLANILGWLLGWFFLMNAHLLSFATTMFGKSVEMYLDEFIMGLFVGTLQWLVLRKYFQWTGWWIILIMVGLVIGHTLFSQVLNIYETTYLSRTFIGGIILGGSIGIMQWIVVRKRIPKDYWWPIGCTLGYAGGLLVTSIIVDLIFPGRPMIDDFEDLINTLLIVVPGIIQGVVTGFVLIPGQQTV